MQSLIPVPETTPLKHTRIPCYLLSTDQLIRCNLHGSWWLSMPHVARYHQHHQYLVVWRPYHWSYSKYYFAWLTKYVSIHRHHNYCNKHIFIVFCMGCGNISYRFHYVRIYKSSFYKHTLTQKDSFLICGWASRSRPMSFTWTSHITSSVFTGQQTLPNQYEPRWGKWDNPRLQSRPSASRLMLADKWVRVTSDALIICPHHVIFGDDSMAVLVTKVVGLVGHCVPVGPVHQCTAAPSVLSLHSQIIQAHPDAIRNYKTK